MEQDKEKQDLKTMSRNDLAAEAAFINVLFSSTNDDDSYPSLSEGLNEKHDGKETIPELYGAQGQRMINNNSNPPISEYYWGVGNSIWTLQNPKPAAEALRSSTEIDTPYKINTHRHVGKDDIQLKIKILYELLDRCMNLRRLLQEELCESISN